MKIDRIEVVVDGWMQLSLGEKWKSQRGGKREKQGPGHGEYKGKGKDLPQRDQPWL